ncbi:beta-ketoacyl-acyl-carrier-protein synthase II [Candidatus Arthromitus sp. SFB-mouse-Japan]|uniref:beta-ketoacyl-ACP synthase II n=1 Tax=Candidatus Arthromitus sp. SFB-mouse TaxID=49118 RepID=UPI00021B7D4B|nr:beta-ketoacyl-ACP synthase II [Candidatus Arthromitus sp. SFB-mouse]EIA24188.1 Beta-ketoacyl-acyl-carrier-protein synthase II [Candidatus Arthromitus sp. SFB-2]EIA24467.1 Beta-ketoacyl-acyl-carrier-protein synthase II [Candidatus Arthromitus sp. SFB-1]EIA27749.1 Beta-ketoacyl-acyl-carrier-protein synthase II [Candidatus Arthromitus sp. SFB-co]EIA30890.1 Beta-ketoacyl-acyl-carrier-protein synthase II [Candidatus Arthromitus sp. SFB-mouse-SU]EIA31481.1 Beta-ketoacyl-acyl-carrier-protein synth
MDNRVVVTGMGAITPIGNDVLEFWKNAKEGVIGIEAIGDKIIGNDKVKVIAPIKNFDVSKRLNAKECSRLDPYSTFALYAAEEAIQNSKLDLESIDRDRFGVIVGSGVGGFNTLEEVINKLKKTDSVRLSPLTIPKLIINMAAGNIAIKYGARGESKSVVTACATSTHSVGDAYRLLKHGYLDICITGGSESAITSLALGGFTALTALNTTDNPERASIPFDKERNGFVMGEGAGILILETLESAQKRGAYIYAEIVGYSSTTDAYHITAPMPDGKMSAKAMQNVLDEAGISYDQVDYINAHGTSTKMNDAVETIAIKEVFKEHAYNLKISSTKSMTGHLLGASGAVEAIACVKSCEEDFIHPTASYLVKDEECDLNYVPNKGIKKEVNYAMSNSLGFGGHNAVLLFKKWRG